MSCAAVRTARTCAGRCQSCGRVPEPGYRTCSVCRARVAQWERTHPGEGAQRSKQWAAIHREALRAYQQQYRATGKAPGTVLGLVPAETPPPPAPEAPLALHPATRWWWDIRTKQPVLDED